MIYAPENCYLILRGIKGQTRRPVLEDDMWQAGPLTVLIHPTTLLAGMSVFLVKRKGRLLWQVGKTYAIKPGRTKKSVGRIKLLSIRSERVGDISKEDAIAEGVYLLSQEFWGTSPGKEGPQYGYKMNGKCFIDSDPRQAYLKAWKSFYPKSDFTEDIWVLEFEAVKQ